MTTSAEPSTPSGSSATQQRRRQITSYKNDIKRWVRSVKEECLSKVILFGERSLRRALSEYVEHYHAERNHQGKDNVLLFPAVRASAAPGLRNAVSDWVGSCVITIKRRRDRAPKAQS